MLLFPTRAVNDGERDGVRYGRYPVRGEVVRLEPPVDWQMDPFENLSWRFWLHTMQFLDVPLRMYEEEGDLDALARARDLVLDWIDRNRAGSDTVGDYAWVDMSAGVRASFIGYVWRECARRGILEPEAEGSLVASIRSHAAWLLDDENYTATTNHGLYEDAGLFLMAIYAAALDGADEWRRSAEERFLRTLARHVDFEEGLHKEHSPGYHMYIRELVLRLHERAGIGGRELKELLPKLDRAAGWLVLPDGRMLPFGDTDLVEAPEFAREASSQAAGLASFLATGYAVVRDEDSYLAMTGCYHTHAHKHADELSWCLFEKGRLLVADPGRFSFSDESDPARVYARSRRGHNVLLVEDGSPRWIDQEPYGSALRATGQGEGWYAILGENPLLERARHERLLLYRPGEIVLVVDRVSGHDGTELVRRLQLGDGLDTRESSGGFEILADGEVLATTFDADERKGEWSVATGIEDPEPDGWIFPREKERRPAPALTLTSSSVSGTLVHGLLLAPLSGSPTVHDEGSGLLVSTEAGTGFPAIRVARSGTRLEIEHR